MSVSSSYLATVIRKFSEFLNSHSRKSIRLDMCFHSQLFIIVRCVDRTETLNEALFQ